jgi:hypothetical protein
MDTLRDRKLLEDLWAAGNAPWATWTRALPAHAPPLEVDVKRPIRRSLQSTGT